MKAGNYRLLLAVIVIVVFARACTNDFVGLDDSQTIYMNPAFNPPTFGSVMSFWSPKNPQGALWIPVTYTVWGALATIAHVDVPGTTGSHLNPHVYHSASVLVHLATTLVVFELLRGIVGKDSRAAFIGAVLYAVHPIQVEPVAWASGLKDVLCGLLTISAGWQYLMFVQTKKRRHYIIGLALFVLGMLSKPTAIVTPALALALDWVVENGNARMVEDLAMKPRRRSSGVPLALRRGVAQQVRLRSAAAVSSRSPQPQASQVRAILMRIAPWFVLAIPCLVWTKIVQPAGGIPTVPLWARPLLAADNLAFYLYKLVWPAQLSADYGRRPLLLMETGELYLRWPIPLAVAALLWRRRKKVPLLVLAGIIFIIGVLPVIGFMPFHFQAISASADHYLYISMLGPALAVAWLAQAPRMQLWGLRLYIIAIVLIALTVRSVFQEGAWKDGMTLFNHILEVNPDTFSSDQNRAPIEIDHVAIRGALA